MYYCCRLERASCGEIVYKKGLYILESTRSRYFASFRYNTPYHFLLYILCIMYVLFVYRIVSGYCCDPEGIINWPFKTDHIKRQVPR